MHWYNSSALQQSFGTVYGTGTFSIDNMIYSVDQAITFAARLGIDTGVMSAVRGVYAKAAEMGLGANDVAAVYEAVNPRG